MPANLYNDEEYVRPEARCAFCFKPKNGQKFIKRHLTNEYVNLHVQVCDTKCGDLWQEEVRNNLEKMFAYAASV